MRFTIGGAGALGSIIAVLLARSGHDVTLVARGERGRRLQAEGVRLAGLLEAIVPVHIALNPAEVREADVLILCVKTYDTEAALASLAHFRPRIAFSIQNGVLKNDQLAAAFGPASVLGCMADFSGEVTADGAALFTRNEGIHLGEPSGGISPRVEELAAVMNEAGIRTIASDRIKTVEWSKFVAWLGLTPVSVLSRLFTYQFAQDPDLARLIATIVQEVGAVAGKLTIPLEDLGGLLMAKTLTTASLDEASAVLQRFGKTMEENGVTAHKMSALQDTERGRRLEVEETLGDALRRAEALELPVPALETCYRLLSGLNRATMR